jgi:hypothetical protein
VSATLEAWGADALDALVAAEAAARASSSSSSPVASTRAPWSARIPPVPWRGIVALVLADRLGAAVAAVSGGGRRGGSSSPTGGRVADEEACVVATPALLQSAVATAVRAARSAAAHRVQHAGAARSLPAGRVSSGSSSRRVDVHASLLGDEWAARRGGSALPPAVEPHGDGHGAGGDEDGDGDDGRPQWRVEDDASLTQLLLAEAAAEAGAARAAAWGGAAAAAAPAPSLPRAAGRVEREGGSAGAVVDRVCRGLVEERLLADAAEARLAALLLAGTAFDSDDGGGGGGDDGGEPGRAGVGGGEGRPGRPSGEPPPAAGDGAAAPSVWALVAQAQALLAAAHASDARLEATLDVAHMRDEGGDMRAASYGAS